MKQNRASAYILTALCLTALLATGCSGKSRTGDESGEESYIHLTAIASRSINQDQVLWEDRVDELRMIMFRSDNGEVALNQKLYFPDGFDQASRAVRVAPGTYDFCFIANETVYAGDFVTALEEIANRSELTTDPRLLSLDYRPEFTPDGNSASGRFLMSALYDGIAVATGGTETNPLPLSLPTARVELIRALAKVEVIFRKQAAGSTIPDNTVTSVQLVNVASEFSVPPDDAYYTGATEPSPQGSLAGLDYSRDSIGAVIFYIPEFLAAAGATEYTGLHINNQSFPIQTDAARAGLTAQRRTVTGLSDNCVIRNYHYQINAYINAQGGVQIWTYVDPWSKDAYTYIFQDDLQIVIPPVEPTDSSILIPTDCGRIELHRNNEFLPQGLYGAFHDQVDWTNSTIIRGNPPYYCEQKYGPGWRLINSCELMSFLAYCDEAYNVLFSNTWEGANNGLPYYPLPFRRAALTALELLTDTDLSASVLYDTNNNQDVISNDKVNLIDDYFTPGDILLRPADYPGGWPFAAPSNTSPDWFYTEVALQVKAFYYPGYISPTNRDNWNAILYSNFERYDYSSTMSRCVRSIE